MHQLFVQKKYLALIFIFVFLVFLLASLYIGYVQSQYILTTKLKISQQETTLAALSELTNRGGADAVVESIIKDCSLENRERFDQLLGKLSSLNGLELGEIEQLFNACGNFFAERKAVMVARLEREYEVYLDLIELLALVDKEDAKTSYKQTEWSSLVEEEKKRSELYTRLVQIQGDIIISLKEGMPISAESMQLLLVEGQQTRDSLDLASVRIDDLREGILNL